MANKTDIFNLALAHVGSTFAIADGDTEQSKEARACRRFYDIARESVLSDLDWSFARKHVKLAILEGETDPRYQYVYKYPSDCLVVRSLVQPYLPVSNQYDCAYPEDRLQSQAVPERLRTPWKTGLDSESETRTIVTDMEEAQIVYTSNLEVEAIYPSYFVAALAMRLAMNIAFPVAGSPSIAQGLQGAYQLALEAAAVLDMNESQDEMCPTPETITSRIV
jgi:hypothetical protein